MSAEQERYEILVNRAVDGVLSPEEKSELDTLIAQHPERANELADFLKIKGETDAMTERILATAHAIPPREAVGTKRGINLSFGLIFSGLAGFCAIEAYFFFVAPDVPMLVKVAGGLVGAGVTGLFVHTLKRRFVELKHDPYQEIDR